MTRLTFGVVVGCCVITVSAHAQTQSLFYGILDIGPVYTNKIAIPGGGTASRTELLSGNLQGSRFGFRATEDLGGGLKAILALESGINLDTGTLGQGGALWGRTATVGLSNQYGSITLGRQTDFIYDLSALYSSVTPMGGIILGSHANNLDRALGARTNNSIRYTSKEMGGLVLSAIYGLGESVGSSSPGQSLGVGANYTSGPFGIGFGYYQSKLGVISGTPAVVSSSDANAATGNGCSSSSSGSSGDTCIKTWLLGGSYKAGPALFYGTWSQVKYPLAVRGAPAAPLSSSFLPVRTQFAINGSNNNKTSVVDVGLTYSITGALALLASTQYTNVDFIGARNGTLRQFNVGADYYFSKRTDIYGLIGTMAASDMYSPGMLGAAPGSNNRQTVIEIGIRHKF